MKRLRNGSNQEVVEELRVIFVPWNEFLFSPIQNGWIQLCFQKKQKNIISRIVISSSITIYEKTPNDGQGELTSEY
jgi:hypothetical protein